MLDFVLLFVSYVCIYVVPGILSMAVAADISKPEDVQKMIDDIVSKWGTIHIACNNAGINKNSASEDTSLEEWDQTFNVNLRGTFMCCQVPHYLYILFAINSSWDYPFSLSIAEKCMLIMWHAFAKDFIVPQSVSITLSPEGTYIDMTKG